MGRITYLKVLVDWDSARRIHVNGIKNKRQNLLSIFYSLQDKIARHINNYDSSRIYSVSLRLYHGWWSGCTKTFDRKELDADIKNISSRKIMNVLFNRVEFNDFLISDADQVYPLYHTLRKRDKEQMYEQKLIDTSLACDVVYLSYQPNKDPIYVVGDDDDLLPPVFFVKSKNKRDVFIIRISRDNDSCHYDTKNIILR
jgi:hypothetical protein